jgi:ribosome-associated protein
VTDAAAVAVRGDVIRLGQFLKVADAVEQGSDVKALLAAGVVSVNGDVEIRRGRQLHIGDIVAVGPTRYRIVARGPDERRDAKGQGG